MYKVFPNIIAEDGEHCLVAFIFNLDNEFSSKEKIIYDHLWCPVKDLKRLLVSLVISGDECIVDNGPQLMNVPMDLSEAVKRIPHSHIELETDLSVLKWQ